MKRPVLPDILASGLAIVFCGTAPGTVSAARKQYYAHPQNKFWRVLYDVGLTPRQLAPSEYPELLSFGIGLTDIAKHTSGMDNQLPRGSLGASAVSDLHRRIERHQPDNLAFTSLTGGRKFLGADTTFGLQSQTIDKTAIWVLPSPSPAAHWNWQKNLHVWRALAEHVRSGKRFAPKNRGL
jgi:TDG/mug DNA glycosylase family protein